MGRYFNDDMLEEQNEDYDAYIEHYGIPKDKWDPQVRARYEQLHHKTEDALRKSGIGHDNRSGLQKAGDYFTKKKVRGVGFNRQKGLYLKRSTDFQNAVEKTGKSIEKAYTNYNKGAQRIVANNQKRYGSKSRSKASYRSISDTARKTARRAGSVARSAASSASKAARRGANHVRWEVNHARSMRHPTPDRTQADYERNKQLRSNLRQSVSRGVQAAHENAERAQRERNRRRYGLNTADQERRKGQAANRRRARRNTV